MRRAVLPAILAAAAIPAAGAAVRQADPVRASWAWRRDVRLLGGGELASLTVPLDVARRSQVELHDLRLVAEDGTEVPYLALRSRTEGTAVVSSWPGRLTDHHREAKQRSVWTVDLGEPRTFDRIDLDIPASDFAKRVTVEASEDARSWTALVDDAGVFDRDWGGRLHHTHLDLPRPARARWLRLTADDQRSRSVDVAGVRVSAVRARGTMSEWREAFAGSGATSSSGATRYRIDVPAGTPVDALLLDADDPAFARLVTVYEVHTSNGRREERRLGEKKLYRLRLGDEALSVEDLRLPLSAPPAGELLLVVQDGDSPPLRNLRGFATGVPTRLLYPVGSVPVSLYYGNPVTRAPLYDLESLRARLTLARDLAEAQLGDESANPRFAPPPPLPLVAATGAAVETSRWRWRRELPPVRREDIFTLRLGPADVIAARRDLGDVRVVDDEDRQVPFVLADDAGEARLELTVEPLPDRAADPRRRRLRLRLPPGNTPPFERAPVQSLEVDVAESFFSRPARVWEPPGAGTRDARMVASSILARASETGREISSCRIALDGGWYGDLWLEIDEGDNAPLTVRSVQAVVKVPRLVLKARPGKYHLLVGNDRATRPQYDLATLRQEILSYSATATEPGPLEANPRFRRRGADYLRQAPATVLLWGTLAAAVAALLFLTVRILRAPVS